MSNDLVADGRGPATSGRWTPPRVLPASWTFVDRGLDGCTLTNAWGLSIIATVSTERDGREWVHLSLAHRRRLPTWDELVAARNLILGDVETYQVLPAENAYVRDHPTCLHLFHCLDGPQLPDFRVDRERNHL